MPYARWCGRGGTARCPPIPIIAAEATFIVGEIGKGKVVPYPDTAINEFDPARPGETLGSVQSVVIDPANRLWILDTAAPGLSSPVVGGAKLVAAAALSRPLSIWATREHQTGSRRMTGAGSSRATISATAFGNARPMANGGPLRRSEDPVARHVVRSIARLSVLYRQPAPSTGAVMKVRTCAKKPYTLFRVKLDAGPSC